MRLALSPSGRSRPAGVLSHGAEGAGFDPAVRVNGLRFSSCAVGAARAALRRADVRVALQLVRTTQGR